MTAYLTKHSITFIQEAQQYFQRTPTACSFGVRKAGSLLAVRTGINSQDILLVSIAQDPVLFSRFLEPLTSLAERPLRGQVDSGSETYGFISAKPTKGGTTNANPTDPD